MILYIHCICIYPGSPGPGMPAVHLAPMRGPGVPAGVCLKCFSMFFYVWSLMAFWCAFRVTWTRFGVRFGVIFATFWGWGGSLSTCVLPRENHTWAASEGPRIATLPGGFSRTLLRPPFSCIFVHSVPALVAMGSNRVSLERPWDH